MRRSKTPLSELFPTTHIYRGAGFVLRAQDTGCILALHNIKGNAWGTPGGRVDPGEDFQQAAVRELREETGYAGALLNIRPLPMNQVRTADGMLCYQAFYAEVARQFTPMLDDREIIGFQWVRGFSEWPLPRRAGVDFLEAQQIPEVTSRPYKGFTR